MAYIATTKPPTAKQWRGVKTARPTPTEGNPATPPPTTGQLYPRGLKTS